jgi:hypothetical protein
MCYGLPLHIGRVTRAAASERLHVIDGVASTGPLVLPVAGQGVCRLKSRLADWLRQCGAGCDHCRIGTRRKRRGQPVQLERFRYFRAFSWLPLTRVSSGRLGLCDYRGVEHDAHALLCLTVVRHARSEAVCRNHRKLSRFFPQPPEYRHLACAHHSADPGGAPKRVPRLPTSTCL